MVCIFLSLATNRILSISLLSAVEGLRKEVMPELSKSGRISRHCSHAQKWEEVQEWERYGDRNRKMRKSGLSRESRAGRVRPTGSELGEAFCCECVDSARGEEREPTKPALRPQHASKSGIFLHCASDDRKLNRSPEEGEWEAGLHGLWSRSDSESETVLVVRCH